MVASSQAHESVKAYYGTILRSNRDLKTSACCASNGLPSHHKTILADIADEIHSTFYGCGAPLPDALDGATVLDLGCGSGRDVYLLSKLVGPAGRVIGIDMTEEQLAVARKYQDAQAERFGYAKSNVDFRLGYIEDLAACGIADASVDVVISNCVINLSPDKPRVYAEIFRVLKPGGELHVSDVFASRRLPEALLHDPELHGECLAGAMYAEDFRRLLAGLGCPDVRVTARAPITVADPAIADRLGPVQFESRTVRAFKLEGLEDRCEDYGQTAAYLGTIPHCPWTFALDGHHLFERGKPMLVCGNTAAMLKETRFAPHFAVTGDRSVHYGLFDCGPMPESGEPTASSGCC